MLQMLTQSQLSRGRFAVRSGDDSGDGDQQSHSKEFSYLLSLLIPLPKVAIGSLAQ